MAAEFPLRMLTSKERQALKGKAHKLGPAVLVGGKGLTDEVIAELERALVAHELIKVRAPGLDRDARNQALAELCQRTGAEAVQHVGKVFVLYRKRP